MPSGAPQSASPAYENRIGVDRAALHQRLTSSNTELEREVAIRDYSVSNRGLRAGLVGTPEQIAERIRGFEDAGLDLMLLQFSPQLEEMERFAEEVIPLGNGT